MLNLFLRSILVLSLLFGLLFAVGVAVWFYFELPLWSAALFALGILLLQYILGPTILEWIYKIEWHDVESLNPRLAQFIKRTCSQRGIPPPRFGLIRDGNPNAFTFGHYPGDARLVITTGLSEKLEDEELEAVVAHELGHIAHWDFVVMTVATAVPLLLYLLYMSTRGSRGRRRGKSGGVILLVAIISYMAYVISHYIVLLLSRVREYYADQFSGQATRNPGALSSALVKIAYGLAVEKQAGEKGNRPLIAARAMGIFDPQMAQNLALVGAGSGAVTTASMEDAMKWDLWNPWAKLFELASSHPLPARRIRALERQAQSLGRTFRTTFQAKQPESYWDEFLVDLTAMYLPMIGLIMGVGLGVLTVLQLNYYWGAIGIVLLIIGATTWLKRWFSYHHDFHQTETVGALVGEVKVSSVRSIPCTLQGKIIGRGVPGLFYSEDLVLQDRTGFILLDYRQPLRFLEFLFGWIRAEKLIGQECKAMGWFRRSPKPYLEIRRMVLKDGTTVTSYLYPFQQFLVYLSLVVGLVLLGVEILL